MNLRELANTLKQLGSWLDWERETLDDFHAYAHKFGGRPGGNVFEFVLRDALRNRGITLEQFQAERQPLSSAISARESAKEQQ